MRWAVLLAFMLAGCQTLSDIPKAFDLPVPVSCVKEGQIKKPVFPDTDAALLASPTKEDRAKRVIAGRPLHFSYEDQLEAALEACK